jgi:hypothetical protein
MGQMMDLTGQKFGRLTAVSRAPKLKSRNNRWNCVCECGNTTTASCADLRSGHSNSCGCYMIDRIKETNTTHGQALKTPEYNTWNLMRDRCTNPNNNRYMRYGGRGIKVCDRWLNSFENFFKDMGKRPSYKHSIDRWPNNDGNYEPGNCRWGTKKEQADNTGRNIWIEYEGRKMVQEDWARHFGICSGALARMVRIKKLPEAFDYYKTKYYKGKTDNNFFVMNIN